MELFQVLHSFFFPNIWALQVSTKARVDHIFNKLDFGEK